jgi:hypothetical protein
VSDDESPDLPTESYRWPASAAPSARGLTPQEGYDEMIADLERTRDSLTGEKRRQVETLLDELRAMPPKRPDLRIVRDEHDPPHEHERE